MSGPSLGQIGGRRAAGLDAISAAPSMAREGFYDLERHLR